MLKVSLAGLQSSCVPGALQEAMDEINSYPQCTNTNIPQDLCTLFIGTSVLINVIEWCLYSKTMLVGVYHRMSPNPKDPEVTLSVSNNSRVPLLMLSGNTHVGMGAHF